MVKLTKVHQLLRLGSRAIFPAIILASFAPVTAMAQQKAMLEKSASYAIDNNFKAYRVPVLDSIGNIKYYDITTTLAISATGVVSTTAKVTANPSTNILSMVISPGTYKSSDGTICTVTNSTTSSGRIHSAFSCVGAKYKNTFAVANGPVSTGHPYLSTLQAAGIDKLPEADSKNWGVVLSTNGQIDGCSSSSSYPIGVIPTGNFLTISFYTTRAVFSCGTNIVKQ